VLREATAGGPISGLSVIIIAKNEADRIGPVISAVRDLASEIVVVDSGSDDGTQAVAATAGARVVHNDWPGYGPQKRFAEDQAKGPWLFNIDADEWVPPELAQEIRRLFAAGEPPSPAYRVSIAEQFPGEAAPHRLAYALDPVRLYRKDAGRYNPSTVHDRVDLKPGVKAGSLHTRIHHRSVRSLSDQLSKLNAYSDMQVEELASRNRRIGEWRILFELPLSFIKGYIGRRHFVRGFYGVATAMNFAISRHLRVAKAIERQRIARLNATTPKAAPRRDDA
jgi:glycosyltransferase involved in cell wall biosynthesis